jgi:hypothetical protein
MDIIELPGIRFSWERPVIGTVLQAVRASRADAVRKERRHMIGNLH